MTDKQAAILALSLLSQSCTAALAPIPSHPTDPAPLPVVLADLDALLALIYNTSTRLALVLKPTASSYPASVPLIHDLTQHTSALAHCSSLLRADLHGATLVKDVRNRVRDIIDALRALVQTFLNNAARGPQLAGSGASGEEYLVRTGTLHDFITNARGPSGIPKDNQAAVYRAWESNKESLDDNLQEIARMIKDAETDAPHDDLVDELDDGWDEIGLGHATRLEKDELARAKNIHQVLRLTTLLHKRIFLDLLAYPSSAPVSAFDNLLVQSSLLLCTSDDLVAALYTPQDPDYVSKEVLELSRIAALLQTQIPVLLPVADQLTVQLHALNIESSSTAAIADPPTKKNADKKWFDTCVDQIVRLCTSVSEPSSQTGNPNVGT